MGLRVVNVGEGEDGGAWARALGDGAWERGSEVLKEDGEVVVRRARVLGRDVVVKRWGLGRVKRRVQAVFNATPGCRHWRGAGLLHESGIRTARVHAMLRGADEGGPCELLVTEWLAGKSLLQTIADGGMSVRQEHRLAEAVGCQLGELYVSSLSNRDHKPSNVMVLDLPSGERGGTACEEHVDRLALIDCVGVSGACKAFQEEFSLLVECVGTGHVPRRSLRMRVLVARAQRYRKEAESWGVSDESCAEPCREWIRSAWSAVAERLDRHGDPTPKVDPLRRPRDDDPSRVGSRSGG
jgi:hypothetical protein